jgi:hypothetical protein
VADRVDRGARKRRRVVVAEVDDALPALGLGCGVVFELARAGRDRNPRKARKRTDHREHGFV